MTQQWELRVCSGPSCTAKWGKVKLNDEAVIALDVLFSERFGLSVFNKACDAWCWYFGGKRLHFRIDS